MVEDVESTERDPVKSHRGVEPTETQADIPEDFHELVNLYDTLIDGHVSSEAV